MKVTTSGHVQQVPAKRQNRGPGNSTGDGFLKAKQKEGDSS
ncbi:single-stranded DNA-binding protein [Salmonella enterica]|nr:single-stranded DNA-binding protein [Salmonella enterica]